MKFTDYNEADRVFDILATTFHHVLDRKDQSFLHINNDLFLKDGPYDEDNDDGGDYDDDGDFHLPDEIVKGVNMFLVDAGMLFIPFEDTSIVIKIEKLLLNNPTLKALIKRNDAQKKAQEKAQKKAQEKNQEKDQE
jgi:hypothetical protein